MSDQTQSTVPASDVLRRTRELFLAQGENASLLDSLKIAAAESGWADVCELRNLLRDAARSSIGKGWRLMALDRAIEEADRAG